MNEAYETLLERKRDKYLEWSKIVNFWPSPEWRMSNTEQTIFSILRLDSFISADEIAQFVNVMKSLQQQNYDDPDSVNVLGKHEIQVHISRMKSKLQEHAAPFSISRSIANGGYKLLMRKPDDRFSDRPNH